MSGELAAINRALNLIPKRAEQQQADTLRETFVDSGVSAAMEVIDHQVIYGRRGTGKTHALRYLASKVQQRGDIPVYVDLRVIGSPDGLFMGETVPPTERAARLLVDLLGQVHEALLTAAIEDDDLLSNASFVDKLDALLESITTVRVTGDIEVSREGEQRDSESRSATLGIRAGATTAASAGLANARTEESRQLLRETRHGVERISINFADVARALRELAETAPNRRVWVLLDEWSSVPPDVQPYLGAFIVRSMLPLQMFTVKIAAIEQQTNFRMLREDGNAIGIELGADVAANLDLDEFMVFEQDEERSRKFFQRLLLKHLTSGLVVDKGVLSLRRELRKESDLIRVGFTDRRAFDELARAAEGVPRDAINIAAKAAFRAGARKISVNDIRAAARSWFQTDKEAAIRNHPNAPSLLNWIIDEVIRHRRARGFLVNQRATGADLLLTLFDARVLHVVRRGYSSQDEPGERYDVWVIDYGAYVDLIHTKSAPQGLLLVGKDDEDDEGQYVNVPTQDLRAIRRAILDLSDFSRDLARRGVSQEEFQQ